MFFGAWKWGFFIAVLGFALQLRRHILSIDTCLEFTQAYSIQISDVANVMFL